MKLKTALASGAAALALVASQSASAEGYYLGVFGGWATFGDELNFNLGTSFTGKTTQTTTSAGFTTYLYASIVGAYGAGWSDDFDNGWVIGAALGYDFGGGWRGEIEAAFRSFDIDNGAKVNFAYTGTLYTYSRAVPTGVGTTTTSPVATYSTSISTNLNAISDGDVAVWSFMGNLWYDFDLGDSPIVPFIGGGVGMAQLDVSYRINVAIPIVTLPSYSTFSTTISYGAQGDDWVFAYQFGAGLGYQFDGGGMLSAQYRYFGTGEADIGTSSLKAESHNFLVGLNFPLN